MKEIKLNLGATISDTFNDFIVARKAKGLADKTLTSYQSHFKAIARHLDITQNIEDLSKSETDKMIASMRDSGLSANSINSYTRLLKAFLSWCNEEDITQYNIKIYRGEETIKETYTDRELAILLKKPKVRECSFGEYRDWVIINFLLNSGCRAATIRAIQIRDLDLDCGTVHYRHTKNRKPQVIPLCSEMIKILREYLRFRRGADTDPLFCTEYGLPLTENALRKSIVRYNTRRGISKTSIHLFRHTFARKYLIDCGGDAFTLQKLLGHSTLQMTKHYCTIFDADITKNYDNFSPLAQIKQGKERITLKKQHQKGL
ncbi:MAG: tyrosine-type recombinase/integrase [Clostridia bacterium]|nr:tyrosine-type recombinase/integrase [Clostridia bacterium]